MTEILKRCPFCGRKLASADWNARPIENELEAKIAQKENARLRKAFTFENFKKLLYFVNCCAGEGFQLGKVCADELLYCDAVLAAIFKNLFQA